MAAYSGPDARAVFHDPSTSRYVTHRYRATVSEILRYRDVYDSLPAEIPEEEIPVPTGM